eukprot:6112545-Lingulodinium_polyedra.AAC.1
MHYKTRAGARLCNCVRVLTPASSTRRGVLLSGAGKPAGVLHTRTRARLRTQALTPASASKNTARDV